MPARRWFPGCHGGARSGHRVAHPPYFKYPSARRLFSSSGSSGALPAAATGCGWKATRSRSRSRVARPLPGARRVLALGGIARHVVELDAGGAQAAGLEAVAGRAPLTGLVGIGKLAAVVLEGQASGAGGRHLNGRPVGDQGGAGQHLVPLADDEVPHLLVGARLEGEEAARGVEHQPAGEPGLGGGIEDQQAGELPRLPAVEGPHAVECLGPGGAGLRGRRVADEPRPADARGVPLGMDPRQFVERRSHVHQLRDPRVTHRRVLIGMDHQQRHVEGLAVELGVIEQAVLQELLAVVGGDDHRHVARQAQPLEVGEEFPHHLVGLPDAAVVDRAQPVDHRPRQRLARGIDPCELRPGGIDRPGRRRPGPERLHVLLRRVVRGVHGVGVEEEEEALAGLQPLEEVDAAAEGGRHGAVAVAVAADELVEAAAEAVAPADVSPLGEAGGAEAAALEDLGHRLHLRRQHGVGGEHPVLARVEAGQHRHVGDEGARELRVRLLEQSSPPRQRIEERRGGACIAVAAEMVGAQRVNRDQDVAARRPRQGRRRLVPLPGAGDREGREGRQGREQGEGGGRREAAGEFHRRRIANRSSTGGRRETSENGRRKRRTGGQSQKYERRTAPATEPPPRALQNAHDFFLVFPWAV